MSIDWVGSLQSGAACAITAHVYICICMYAFKNIKHVNVLETETPTDEKI